ncbi:20S proteasome subunit beta 7 [Babesia microti strain RI]|uniref:Proteasome subunit beta n=1 Tax=Babesia microti (strain RI) TaxID=1133968 RepID=A0A1N6LWR9_BABMR|nr:20S proteasome subunit beta 7 [Babesia microti strain RI]SIO73317.1 20S proteasome subunit beta 7 [Babesia microti strain RI]|eukprot:XP_021337419.1 20S proteasome subunit beta 7 [Babesia microti strain RI]
MSKIYVNCSSAIGIKFNGGILIAADTQACSGSSIKFPNVQRVDKVGNAAIFACSGEYADCQWVSKELNKLFQEFKLEVAQCQAKLTPVKLHSYLTNVLYKRRSQMNPLLLSTIIGGKEGNDWYLGYSDLFGTAYTEDFMATGMGRYFAIGILRQYHSPNMNAAQAKELAIKCLQILYLRDCGAGNNIQIGVFTDCGIEISEPIFIETQWSHNDFYKPTISLPLAGCQF